jgi:hypothetical protein
MQRCIYWRNKMKGGREKRVNVEGKAEKTIENGEI